MPRRLLQLAFWGALILIAWLAVTPVDKLPPVNVWDKLAHAIAFAALMLLGGLAHRNSIALAWIALLLFLYGAGIELVQHFLPSREFSLEDMLANGIGILLMWPLVAPLGRLLKTQTP